MILSHLATAFMAVKLDQSCNALNDVCLWSYSFLTNKICGQGYQAAH